MHAPSHDSGAFRCGLCSSTFDNEAHLASHDCPATRRNASRADKRPFPTVRGYTIDKELKSGQNGMVYLAHRSADGERVAVKLMLLELVGDKLLEDRFWREIEKTELFRGHANIVRFISRGQDGNNPYLIIEFCPGGSVADLMKRRGGSLVLTEAKPLMLDAVEALSCVHSAGVTHSDLKPQNLLLSGEEPSWTAKLADFGVAKARAEHRFYTTKLEPYAETPLFTPLEAVEGTFFKNLSLGSDVWSLGATFYNMLTGENPRGLPPDISRQEAVKRIPGNRVIPIAARAPHLPPQITALIDRALDDDVSKRFPNGKEMREALCSAFAAT